MTLVFHGGLHSPNQFWPDGILHDSASLFLLRIIQSSIFITYTHMFVAFTFRAHIPSKFDRI